MIPDNSQLTLNIDKNADFIFKKGDYIHTYIVIDTSGLPNNALLFLLDENFEQLYSPYDTNGNNFKTKCYVRSGETDIIPLPARYINDEWEDFDIGVYRWNLKFYGDDYYQEKTIPLTVEIRDFSVCKLIKKELYPFEDLEIQVRTYIDTIPLPEEINFYDYQNSEYIPVSYTYDTEYGIITRELNNLDFGKYHAYPKNHTIYDVEFEIIPPLELSYTVENHAFKLTATYWFGKNIPAVNQCVIIKNMDTNEIVCQDITNELGEIYYSTRVEGNYQAFTYFYKKVITNIDINNRKDLIYTVSVSTDNDGVVNDIYHNNTTNNIDFIVENFSLEKDSFSDMSFDGDILYLDGNSIKDSVQYASNTIVLNNYAIYLDININDDGQLIANDTTLLDININQSVLDDIIDMLNGNLESTETPYHLFDNIITDIDIDNGILEYKNIDDL